MIAGIIVTWGFWLLGIGVLIYWKRSWVNLIIIPIILTIIIYLLSVCSDKLSMWFSIITHLFLILMITIGMFKDKGINDWKRPK
ncbi:UNVERIFIED_CONTAM: hypothetical protein Cloal_4319 [Acetivibrio alkalicellulosi]